MTQISFKGHSISLKGAIPKEGQKSPDFSFTKADLSEGKLSDYDQKIRVVIVVPSIDTSVCAAEARKFNEQLDGKEGVVGIVISKDLPFALNRFCEAEGLKSIVPASDFRGGFASMYPLVMENGPLAGLLARAVILIDRKSVIRQVQIVPEVTKEPNYDSVLQAVDTLLNT